MTVGDHHALDPLPVAFNVFLTAQTIHGISRYVVVIGLFKIVTHNRRYRIGQE